MSENTGKILTESDDCPRLPALQSELGGAPAEISPLNLGAAATRAYPIEDANHVKVLDKGYIKLLDTFGDELTIVNAARVSFGVEKFELSKKDIGLIRYLYRNKHFSPFRHLMFRFHIKAPEVVMRQLYKHVVGIEATAADPTKDHAWNEISGRYKPVQDYYYPEVWRKQSASSKQASDGVVDDEHK